MALASLASPMGAVGCVVQARMEGAVARVRPLLLSHGADHVELAAVRGREPTCKGGGDALTCEGVGAPVTRCPLDSAYPLGYPAPCLVGLHRWRQAPPADGEDPLFCRSTATPLLSNVNCCVKSPTHA